MDPFHFMFQRRNAHLSHEAKRGSKFKKKYFLISTKLCDPYRFTCIRPCSFKKFNIGKLLNYAFNVSTKFNTCNVTHCITSLKF